MCCNVCRSRLKVPIPVDLIVVIISTYVSHFGNFQQNFGVKVCCLLAYIFSCLLRVKLLHVVVDCLSLKHIFQDTGIEICLFIIVFFLVLVIFVCYILTRLGHLAAGRCNEYQGKLGCKQAHSMMY